MQEPTTTVRLVSESMLANGHSYYRSLSIGDLKKVPPPTRNLVKVHQLLHPGSFRSLENPSTAPYHSWQLEMGAMMEQLNTQFGEAMEFIGLLCSANTISRDIMCDINQALDTTRAQVMSLRRAQQETQARERDRDQTIETMAAKIQELQRRLDKNQGKP
ncbi:hypothetical protein CTI12_AA501000 [Artemisia annua]|uniref:Uncharacterized protein n=1 Tax=Artemisia annua TaxID=35608 RepID=A0A2U1LDS7_ARTAN|nr:hypothetical protein CTI12_AA501000 [Artemisia annua]